MFGLIFVFLTTRLIYCRPPYPKVKALSLATLTKKIKYLYNIFTIQRLYFYQFYHIIPHLERVNLNAIRGPDYQMSSSKRVHSAIEINPEGIEFLGATVFYDASKHIYLVHNNLCLSVL